MKSTSKQKLTPIYNRFPLTLVSGTGAEVLDDQGKHYLDLTAGIGVNSLGYGHPEWVRAVQQQAQDLVHTSNLFLTTPVIDAAEKLIEKTAMEHVIFVNSGAEANEVAIKCARKYGHQFTEHKHEIITLANSFHGRTITTLAATGQSSFHQFFQPFTAGFVHAAVNELNQLRQMVNEHTCAIMIEVFQGEGGLVMLSEPFAIGIQAIAEQENILLIIDEVQTGIGRTGQFFAYQHYGLRPDIVTTAKGLAGGLPLGAILFGERVKDVLSAGDHGSTFGGNVVSCAGANVVLDTLNEPFLADVLQKGNFLVSHLKTIPGIDDAWGMGLMIGFHLSTMAPAAFVEKARDLGVLVLTAKDNIRLLPPLIISQEQLEYALTCFATILKED